MNNHNQELMMVTNWLDLDIGVAQIIRTAVELLEDRNTEETVDYRLDSSKLIHGQ
jgi:hypothetical protein